MILTPKILEELRALRSTCDVAALAEHFGVRETTIRRWFAKLGVPASYTGSAASVLECYDQTELQHYYECVDSHIKAGKALGVAPETFRDYGLRRGWVRDRSRRGTFLGPVPQRTTQLSVAAQRLKELLESGASASKAAKAVGHTRQWVYTTAAAYGLRHPGRPRCA